MCRLCEEVEERLEQLFGGYRIIGEERPNWNQQITRKSLCQGCAKLRRKEKRTKQEGETRMKMRLMKQSRR